MLRSRKYPGDRIDKHDVYEVWGDVVEGAAYAGPAVIDVIHQILSEYFSCETVSTPKDDYGQDREFLIVKWEDMVAHIDARPFYNHLDVYAILALPRRLLDKPDPLARIAELEGWERRDLQVFQTILKWAMEEALEALDEGRLSIYSQEWEEYSVSQDTAYDTSLDKLSSVSGQL
jgi:hypothetical protein